MAYELFNEDGTLFHPPEIGPYKKLLEERFPSCNYDGYSCMFCSRCPKGEYFKWPKDCEEIIAAQELAVNHYINSHNTIGSGGLHLKEV